MGSSARLRLITVGQVRTPHFKAALEDYAGRINRFVSFTAESVASVGLKKEGPADIKRARAEEGRRVIKRISGQDTLVALDKGGRSLDSEAWADWLGRRLEEGDRLCFVVGGAWGLDGSVLDRARWRISLGPMTLAHELCAVVCSEQLFRALTILRGVPYHK
ncbi:MAG: 23S rRNA (pseudouridine(1915)-N(3))-methyltransferase RlmH [Proteobacteria bacterium]|nr:23S rRNA (pseudouridine(1915)-N(3))-methyltransferase RlmH [Pseudomonadota bacterium]MBU1742583.1 23S rRNA (pseudouridine(1915)-N(3))-methyltransferase RlmH [Pseudomonadota bacterium]